MVSRGRVSRDYGYRQPDRDREERCQAERRERERRSPLTRGRNVFAKIGTRRKNAKKSSYAEGDRAALKAFDERRKAQRVEADLAVTIRGGPGETKGKALNISTSGIYFESPHYIAPLTKIRLDLIVPDPRAGELPVTCDGVVVRVEPEKKDPAVAKYRVAILFTLVSESSLKILDAFIRSRLSS